MEILLYVKNIIIFLPFRILEKNSDCPSAPTGLSCLSNHECNRCLVKNAASPYEYEGCDSSSTKPVCDVDEAVMNIQVTGTRKLAECVKCKKSGKF